MQQPATPPAIPCPNCGSLVDMDMLIPAGDHKICPYCKEEYLQRIREGLPGDSSEEFVALRQKHLKHEASLKSVGTLYFIGAIFCILAVVAMLFAIFGGVYSAAETMSGMIGVILFYLVLTVIFAFIGRGYQKLKPWVKIPGGILSGIGLLGFPLGTLINAYILYLLFSKKGQFVLSPQYKEVMAATPGMKYKTPKAAMIFLLVIILAIVGFIVWGTTSW